MHAVIRGPWDEVAELWVDIARLVVSFYKEFATIIQVTVYIVGSVSKMTFASLLAYAESGHRSLDVGSSFITSCL